MTETENIKQQEQEACRPDAGAPASAEHMGILDNPQPQEIRQQPECGTPLASQASRQPKPRHDGKDDEKHSRGLRAVLVALVVVFAACAIAVAGCLMLRPSLDEPVRVYIPSHSTYDAVVDTLAAHNCIANMPLFEVLSHLRGYTVRVKGGSYVVTPDIDLFHLVQKLYSGSQDPVRITIGHHRTKESLSTYVAKKLEFTAEALLLLLDSDSALSFFSQNTYEVYWNTTPEAFLRRMRQETERFWDADRKARCASLGLSPYEVATLASIVEEETNKNDEKPIIASVYLNRLRKGMLLQADPTLKYAVGDFTIRRLTAAHIKVESPYNTYLHPGLPPSPIGIPSAASIDAVLANRTTDYLYFCAKEDFSGYHNFAVTHAEHCRNAARFHSALDQRNIH